MSYIGSTPASQFFAPGTDTFSGDGTTVAFTLSRNVGTVNDILVVVNNVDQQPTAYTVSVSTLTFTAAPSSGTNNIYVRYLSTNLQTIAPQQGSVYPLSLSTQNAVYWDANANVGIGTTSPVSNLHISKSTQVSILTESTASATNGAAYNIIKSGTGAGSLYYRAILGQKADGTFDWGIGNFGTDAQSLAFYSGGITERMRINSDGRIGIGYTGSPADYSNSQVAILTSTNMPLFVGNSSTGTGPAAIFSKGLNSTATSNIFIQFLINGVSGTSGQINANGANSAAFGTYSDSRLKENIVDLPSQIANVMALRPVEYDYIESEGGGHQIGFIAQEVNEIYPDLVGEREDGMFTLTDMNKNDARLIKAIQEQQAMILELKAELDVCKAKVAALEAR
jgi:hypothetical protein